MVVVFLFVGQAAEKTPTNSGNFGRIEKKILFFGHAGGNRHKLLQIASAAADHAAVAHSPYHLCFMAYADLAQLDAGAVFTHQILDQITKVNA